ncbi:MAG: BrnT family toxin [Deltaproteobacteria bacterium]|nr:BrnT family toxin [Deltaproteobacteria bacterium]
MSYNTIYLKIVELVWEEWHIEHIAARHNVKRGEAEEACFEDENARVLRGKGRREGMLYYVLGKTLRGRCLFIVVKHLGKGKAKVITARDMNPSEKRRYNIL